MATGPALPRRPRVTTQRRLVEEGLRSSGRTLTAAELYEALRQHHPQLGRATVFRTLDLLVQSGRAQRFEGEGHVYLYTSCQPAHHHHLVCRTCGGAAEIDDAEVGALIHAVQRRHRFTLDHSSLDFYGTCAHCAEQTISSIS